MTFLYGITKQTVFGNRSVVIGWYKNGGGSTGGDINTGLKNCEDLQLNPWGTAVNASCPVVSATMSSTGPDTNPTKTIVTSPNESGTWYAIGI